MNFDTLFVNPAGRTARSEFIGALITVLAVFAFYYFLVPGRNSQWVQLVLLFPAIVLHARRLHDMGWAAWPVLLCDTAYPPSQHRRAPGPRRPA